MVNLGWIRAGLYVALLIFAFILFAISCARINYTLHLSRRDPLNRGISFYDPVVPELIFTTIVTMAWCILMLLIFFMNTPKLRHLRMYGDELIALVVLWLFWIGGAAAASNLWGDLSFCQQFQACQLLSALEAFAWLGWIVLTVMIALDLWVVLRSRNNDGAGLAEPLPTRDGDGHSGVAAVKPSANVAV